MIPSFILKVSWNDLQLDTPFRSGNWMSISCSDLLVLELIRSSQVLAGTIKKLGININGSTIEAYTQAKPQEIHEFIKYVLPKHHKHKAPLIKNWIVQKIKHNQAVKYEEIFYYLKVIFNIAPWNEQKFP